MKARYTHTQRVVVSTPTGVEVVEIKHDYVHSAPMPLAARRDGYIGHGNRRLTVRQSRQLRKTAKRLQWAGRRAES